MAETKLQIVLELADKATSEFRRATEGMKKDVDKFADSMSQLGRQVQMAGRNMTFLGAAITGPMALAFKTTSNYSIEANDSLQRLTNSTIKFQEIIGNAMIPIVDKLSAGINGLTKWFDSLDPKLRDAIIQGALITGILLTLDGVVTSLTGRIINLAGRLLDFGKAHPILLLISAAVMFMIMNWKKLRDTVMPILNNLQIAWDMLAIGFWKVIQFIANALDFLFDKIALTFDFLARIPGPQQGFFQGLADSARSAADQMGILSTTANATISQLEADMTNIMATNTSALASFVDQSITKITKFWASFTGPVAQQNFDLWLTEAQRVFTAFAAEVNKVGQHMAQIFVDSIKMITSGFGKAVADMIVYGKNFGESMKGVFQSWAAMAIQKIIEVITQWIIMHTIGKALEMVMIAFIAGTASTIASLWAVPAALASLATMGANAGPAAGAIASVTALAQGLAAVPKLAEGGVVNRPTLAMIGEAGPEAVIPLGKGGAGTVINIEINNPNVSSMTDIDVLTEEISRRLNNEIERLR